MKSTKQVAACGSEQRDCIFHRHIVVCVVRARIIHQGMCVVNFRCRELIARLAVM